MSEISVDIQREGQEPAPKPGKRHPNTCPQCNSHYRDDELAESLRVCGHCGFHFAVGSYERISQLVDPGSFVEHAEDLRSADPLAFVDLRPYQERLAEAELKTGLGDAIVVGTAVIGGRPVAIAVMDFSYMGGSMGSVVGEKFARAADLACDVGGPLISVAASGGARMQENILALMQMAKTVAAVDQVQDAGLAYISIIAHPTTGGVIASFAALGDYAIAEPGALMSFAGPRVVQQTTRETLPDDFGLAEANLRLGHVDAVVPRGELRPLVARLVALLSGDAAADEPTGDSEPVRGPGAVSRLFKRLFGRGADGQGH